MAEARYRVTYNPAAWQDVPSQPGWQGQIVVQELDPERRLNVELRRSMGGGVLVAVAYIEERWYRQGGRQRWRISEVIPAERVLVREALRDPDHDA